MAAPSKLIHRQNKTVDVIVIGGGLTGLTAARRVLEAGLTVKVLGKFKRIIYYNINYLLHFRS